LVVSQQIAYSIAKGTPGAHISHHMGFDYIKSAPADDHGPVQDPSVKTDKWLDIDRQAIERGRELARV